jgi:hypothetical protein
LEQSSFFPSLNFSIGNRGSRLCHLRYTLVILSAVRSLSEESVLPFRKAPSIFTIRSRPNKRANLVDGSQKLIHVCRLKPRYQAMNAEVLVSVKSFFGHWTKRRGD